jgi:hypothetical protein
MIQYDSVMTDFRANLRGAFGGWAWIFIVTILTMLIVGYVSRFTLDGAGLIGSLFFIGMAIINPVELFIAGHMIPMWMIGLLSLIVTLSLVAWRYL